MDHPELVRGQLERLLSDRRFPRSERLSRFLRYTIETTLAGRQDDLKEYSIALEVYDKPPSYDPAIDSLVRVEIGRLRTKLSDYYTKEGREDPIHIEFPKGSYVPIFRPQTAVIDKVSETLALEPSLRIGWNKNSSADWPSSPSRNCSRLLGISETKHLCVIY
jgi:hypothetical protein